MFVVVFFFFQAEDGIRDYKVTGVQTCALPIYRSASKEADSRAPHPGAKRTSHGPAIATGAGALFKAGGRTSRRNAGSKMTKAEPTAGSLIFTREPSAVGLTASGRTAPVTASQSSAPRPATRNVQSASTSSSRLFRTK